MPSPRRRGTLDAAGSPWLRRSGAERGGNAGSLLNHPSPPQQELMGERDAQRRRDLPGSEWADVRWHWPQPRVDIRGGPRWSLRLCWGPRQAQGPHDRDRWSTEQRTLQDRDRRRPGDVPEVLAPDAVVPDVDDAPTSLGETLDGRLHAG
jgi:hypothetical protein